MTTKIELPAVGSIQDLALALNYTSKEAASVAVSRGMLRRELKLGHGKYNIGLLAEWLKTGESPYVSEMRKRGKRVK